MGLLDDLLRNMAGQGAAPQARASAGGGMSKALIALLPIVLMMLSRRGQSAPHPQAQPQPGGLGDVLGQVLGQGGPAMRAGPAGGGGLDDLLGQILGGGAAAGGLGGLLEQMRRAGMADQADSWVQRGPNLPISPDALDQIFGRGGMSEIARQAGISEDEARSGLSELLPEVVDRVTPNGNVPDMDSLASSVDELAKQYGFRFR
jgi:uncharacterized protein YidB (DUF937 family)